MLILTRTPGETLKIGDDITVTILEVRNSRQVRIGIEAPHAVHVLRVELTPRPAVLSNRKINPALALPKLQRLSVGVTFPGDRERRTDPPRKGDGGIKI